MSVVLASKEEIHVWAGGLGWCSPRVLSRSVTHHPIQHPWRCHSHSWQMVWSSSSEKLRTDDSQLLNIFKRKFYNVEHILKNCSKTVIFGDWCWKNVCAHPYVYGDTLSVGTNTLHFNCVLTFLALRTQIKSIMSAELCRGYPWRSWGVGCLRPMREYACLGLSEQGNPFIGQCLD